MSSSTVAPPRAADAPAESPVRRLRAAAPPPLKRAAAPVKWAFWRATAPARMLPSFLIIGAQKAGTSSLYEYLTAHPAIPRAATKEVHYFDLNYFRGERWYRAHFPTRAAAARRRAQGVDLAPGEASPYYLFHPLAAARVRETLPDVKLVVLLRDPIKRALSHYHHEVAMGRETLPLEEALEREPGRLAGEADRVTADPRYPGTALQTYSYLSRGRYAEQLERWFAHFDRDRFLIMDAGELYADPQATVDRVCAFVGVPPQPVPAGEAWGARGYPRPSPELLERLRSYYAPHNARLSDLLGADWEWLR